MAREIVTEWPIYRRERMVGLSITAYVASKMTVLVGIAAIQCLLLVAIVAPACRIDSPWLQVFLTLYAAALAGGALGLLISATLKTTEAASGVLPVLLLPMIVLGGILVPLSDLPALTQPLAAAMPSRWAFEGLVVPEADLRPRIRLGHPPAARSERQPQLPHASESPTEAVPPASDGDPATGDTTALPSERIFHLVGNGSGGHAFLLPGRRKIVEKLEEAAGQAKQEIDKAKKSIETKAEKIQSEMKAESEKKMQEAKAEFEKKSAESAERMKKDIEAKVEEAKAAAQKESEAAGERMKAEMEKRVVEAQEQARRESADAREQVRREVEEKVAAAKADAQKESEETATRMRAEMEAKVAEAQVAAKRESDEAGTAARADVEKRVKEIEADFERRSHEATEQLEAKLRQMQDRIESERVRMNDSLDAVRAATGRTILPPAGRPARGAAAVPSGGAGAGDTAGVGQAPPAPGHEGADPNGAPPLDMADRFFATGNWRSPRAMPLVVLLGMFAAGILGTGAALRWRDSNSR